jgi:hypothetical protein
VNVHIHGEPNHPGSTKLSYGNNRLEGVHSLFSRRIRPVLPKSRPMHPLNRVRVPHCPFLDKSSFSKCLEWMVLEKLPSYFVLELIHYGQCPRSICLGRFEHGIKRGPTGWCAWGYRKRRMVNY